MALKQLRRERFLSVRDLARAANLSPQTIVTAEAGGPLRGSTVRKISEALGVSPADVAEFAKMIDAERVKARRNQEVTPDG